MKKFVTIILTLLLSILIVTNTYANETEDTKIIRQMYVLAQLVHAEAGNQSLEGKRLVADVVLNRVHDDNFPDTIEGVIYQDRQFECVSNGSYHRAANDLTEEDCLAVAMEWSEQLDYDIVFFQRGKLPNGYKVDDHWFSHQWSAA